MSENETKDLYLDLQGLTAYSSLGKTTLRELISMGQLPAYCPRGKILVRKSDFDAFLERYRVKPEAEVSHIVADVLNQLREAKHG